VDASVDKRDTEETTCMQADTCSSQNPSVTRISLQFPLNRNTHRHGEKQQEEERENQDRTRERRTLAEKTGFLSSLSLQLFFLFSGGVSLLSSKTDSFPQRKNPPLSLLQTCPQIDPHKDRKPKKHS
jgi:hypothetical protein